MAWIQSLAKELPYAVDAAVKLKKKKIPIMVQLQVKNPSSIHEDASSFPGLDLALLQAAV